MTYPTIGSLCTGYGGLDMGTLAAFGGGHLAWVAENDPNMSTLLQQRLPSLENFGDLNNIDWDVVPRVDIMTAGFPCQDISAAGKRAGIQKGNRSGLFYRIMDAVRVLRPDYVVLENVAALRWKDGGLGEVLTYLAKAGYGVFWTSIRASDIGAPHRRERIFILARPCHRVAETVTASPGCPSAIVSDSGCLRCHPHRVRSAAPEGEGAASQLAGYRDSVSSDSFSPRQRHLSLIADADDIGSNQRISQQQGFKGKSRTHRSGHRVVADPLGRRQSQEPPRDRAAALGTGAGTGHRDDPGHDADRADQLGRSPGLLDWGVYETAIRQWELTLDRPAPHPTEKGRTGRPRLSPLFVEWMMGLPEAWVTGDDLAFPRSAQLQALGNGVVPQQAAVAVLELLQSSDSIADSPQRRAA